MHLSLRAPLVLMLLFCAAFCTAQPVANFTASPVSGCAPLIVQFTSTSTGTNATSTYSWNLGNTVTTSNQNPSTTYTVPGTYPVSLTVNGPGGSNTITKTAFITVYAAPTVSVSVSPTSGCAPLAVTFTPTITPNTPGTATQIWSYGDGLIGSSATHTYTYANTFSASLSVTNSAGCITTVLAPPVTVFPKPGVAFSASPSTIYCAVPAAVTFGNSPVSGVSYSWTFGDGSSGTGGNPSHTYNAAGIYTVSLSAIDGNGCKDTLAQNAYITVQANNASFNAPMAACDSTLVPFTNTTSGVTGSTTWWFGDNTTDTGKVLSHFYTASGTYTVTMVTRVGPCWDTVTKSIVIDPKPVISVSHDMPCLPGGMTFTAISTVPGTTYNWSWASGGSATGNPVTKFYNHCFVDTTYLLATTGAGCKDTIRIDTTFVQDWVPGVDYKMGGCAPRTCTFTADLYPITCIPCWVPPHYPSYAPSSPCFYYHPITSYTWWVDGVLQSSTSNVMSFTIPTPGSHAVVLKTYTANGCMRYDTFYACAGYKMKPSFYAYPDTVVCVKTPVYFKNTTGDSTIKYIWQYGLYEIDTNNGSYNGYHRYVYSKKDTVTLISDVCGCLDTAYGYITVLPGDAHFKDTVACPPSKVVSFRNTSVGATTNYWDFGDGSHDTAANPPPHTYASYGKYYIRLFTSNPLTGCRDTAVDSVNLIPGSINLTTDTTLCLGDTMRLTGNFIGLSIYRALWTIDTISYLSDYVPNITKTTFDSVLTSRGYHSVRWIVNSGPFGRCRDTVNKPNWIIVSHPIANFGAVPRLGCTPLPVVFIDSTSYTPGTQPLSRSWLFGAGPGAGITNNSPTASYTYTSAGLYTIKLKVTDWIGCTDSVTKTNYVEARHPVANYNPSKLSACIGENVVFTNSSTSATGLHYQWSFGDGTGDTAKNIAHAYTAAGSYYVRLIAIDSTGCADTSTATLPIIVTHPTAALTLSDTLAVCPPIIVNFNANSPTATGWDWDFGNGATAIISSPATTYSAPGVYDIRLVVYDGNFCTDTAYAHVRVLGYAGALSYTPLAGCVPLTVNFTANVSNVPVMVWDFSSGDTALVTSPTFSYTYRTPGVYVPKLIFYDGKGCRAASSGLDTIKVDDVMAGFKVVPPCERTPVTLVDTSHSLFSALSSWRWDFGGGQIATGATTTRVYPGPGQYPVRLIVTNARGCIDTIDKNVTIYPLPLITASPDTVVCPPDAAWLTAYGGKSYAWAPAATISCVGCTTTHATPTVPTTYTVTGTDSNGCINQASVKVGIQTKTTFNVTGGGEICLGQQFHLAASGAMVYSWSPSASLTHPDSAGTFASPTATTTYIATAREGSCVADTHSVRVVVNPLPTVDAGSDERVVAGNSISLQASGNGIDHLLWDDDPTLSCRDCFGPYASPKATTTYHVTAYTNKGCIAIDSVTVRVLCDGSQLFIPNTFTPNADGNNDYFYPRGKGIEFVKSFRVYSRWGELLYERTGMAVNEEYAGWNGTYNGQKLAPDVYVYIIEATCDNGEPIKWKGDITLLR